MLIATPPPQAPAPHGPPTLGLGDFGEATPEVAALREWLLSEGAVFPSLTIGLTASCGYSGFALTDLPTNSEVLRVPIALLLSPRRALADAELGVALKAMRVELGKRVVTNDFLVCVLLLSQRALGPAGRWWPYISMLPRSGKFGCEGSSVLHATALWEDAELDSLLAGTDVREATLRARADVKREHAHLVVEQLARRVPSLLSLSQPGGPFSAEALEWAYAIFWSRALGMRVLGEEMGCLVPLLDALNHDVTSTCALKTDAHSYSVQAGRRLAAGEEVRICYGPKGNGELLRMFGFVCADNPADVVRVELAEVELPRALSLHLNEAEAGEAETSAARAASRLPTEAALCAVRSAGLPTRCFLFRGDELPPLLMPALRLLCTASARALPPERSAALGLSGLERGALEQRDEVWESLLSAAAGDDELPCDPVLDRLSLEALTAHCDLKRRRLLGAPPGVPPTQPPAAQWTAYRADMVATYRAGQLSVLVDTARQLSQRTRATGAAPTADAAAGASPSSGSPRSDREGGTRSAKRPRPESETGPQSSRHFENIYGA